MRQGLEGRACLGPRPPSLLSDFLKDLSTVTPSPVSRLLQPGSHSLLNSPRALDLPLQENLPLSALHQKGRDLFRRTGAGASAGVHNLMGERGMEIHKCRGGGGGMG